MSEAENKNIIACSSCGKDVAKGVKKCPHCGKKLKMGLFTKLVLIVVVIIVGNMILNPGKTLEENLQETVSATVEDLSPRGELYQAFGRVMKNEYTDIQRDNIEEKITGNYIQWNLPVYDVNKRKENKYRIQTSTKNNYVGTFIDLYTSSEEQAAYVESLKTGDFISVKGLITGVSMRSIEIEYAVLSN